MKAGFTPATKHDKGRAKAARRFENQDYRAVQLSLMEQPTLHPRTRQGSCTSTLRIMPVARGLRGTRRTHARLADSRRLSGGPL
jgi:hypothetical protein